MRGKVNATSWVRGLGKSIAWCLIFLVELIGSATIVIAAKVLLAVLLSLPAKNVVIQGPPGPMALTFACCEQPTPAVEAFFSNTAVIPAVQDIHANLAVAIVDLSPGRAEVVHRLNLAGIPLTAWIVLPKEQGYYINADNAPAAVARIDEFERWTARYALRWTSVGLDIEPNFEELASLKGHAWRLAGYLLERSLDGARLRRARSAYSALIQRIQSAGYSVQTYQMPFIADEREAGSTLLDRLLGTVEVRGNLEVLMLYTSYSPSTDSAMIWKLGSDAQAIVVGIVAATSSANSHSLGWEAFSRDLIVASHFTRTIGVYGLEGCSEQRFLQRLKGFDWNQSVTIPAKAVRSVTLLGTAIETTLWTFSHLAYLAAVIVVADAWFILWRRTRKRSVD
jgi:hypothetical protein